MNVGLISKSNPDVARTTFNNRETVDIPLGTPVVFVMDGTKDGADAQLPSSSSANKAAMFLVGISLAIAKAGSTGNNAQCYGIAQQVLVSRTITRSATSAVWASAVGVAVGDILTVNTLANVLEFLSAGSAAKNGGWQFGAVGTIASVTTAASTITYAAQNALGGGSTDTIAYITSLVKVFVRMM